MFAGGSDATMAAGDAGVTANAIKASGVLVRVKPEEFAKLLVRAKDPLVVLAEGGIFRTSYHYLMSYKGLAFYCVSRERLSLPGGAETVRAAAISIPA